MRRWLILGLAFGASVSVFLACSSFSAQGEPAADGTDAADEAPQVGVRPEAGDGDAEPPNLIGDIARDGVGGCQDWETYNATTQFYDAGGEGICIMCFLDTDGGVDGGKAITLESFAQWNYPRTRIDAGTTFSGHVELDTPPVDSDAAPAATWVTLNLYIDSAQGPVDQAYGGKIVPTSTGVPVDGSILVTAADEAAGGNVFRFRINGDHSPNSCVAIRHPTVTIGVASP